MSSDFWQKWWDDGRGYICLKTFFVSYENELKRSITSNNKIYLKCFCIVRESNPGRPRGRRAFYHWTNDALMKILGDCLTINDNFIKQISIFTLAQVFKLQQRTNLNILRSKSNLLSSYFNLLESQRFFCLNFLQYLFDRRTNYHIVETCLTWKERCVLVIRKNM